MLKKTPAVTILPGSPAVPAREPAVFCGASVPFGSTSTSQLPAPIPTPAPNTGYWVYVPSNAAYFVSETRTYSANPPSGNYTCMRGSFLLEDSSFPSGFKMTEETRCYWNYV